MCISVLDEESSQLTEIVSASSCAELIRRMKVASKGKYIDVLKVVPPIPMLGINHDDNS